MKFLFFNSINEIICTRTTGECEFYITPIIKWYGNHIMILETCQILQIMMIVFVYKWSVLVLLKSLFVL